MAGNIILIFKILTEVERLYMYTHVCTHIQSYSALHTQSY